MCKTLAKYIFIIIGIQIALYAPHTATAQFTPLIEGLAPTPGDMSSYLERLYILAISAAALLAVGKIILAGIKYTTSGVVTEKQGAKEDIRSALVGLLIILGAVALLRTINPGLANLPALQPVGDLISWEVVPDRPPGTEIVGSGFYALPGDKVSWVGAIFSIKDQEECERKYGIFIPGSGTVGDRCWIRKTSREAVLPRIASENCPTGRRCRAELCDERNLSYFQSCESQCLGRNGIHYDPEVNGCVFYNDSYDPTSVDITVNPDTTYTIKQTPDEEAAGDPPQIITIIGTEAVGGMVEVRLDDGTTTMLSCSYIIPAVCPE